MTETWSMLDKLSKLQRGVLGKHTSMSKGLKLCYKWCLASKLRQGCMLHIHTLKANKPKMLRGYIMHGKVDPNNYGQTLSMAK